MKNLKLFVFALCAMLLSVATVNAASADCYIPGSETGRAGQNACVATLGAIRYDSLPNAINAAFTDGGTLTLYSDWEEGAVRTVPAAKRLDVNANGHTITVDSGAQFVVPAKSTLTVTNGSLVTKTSDPFVVQKDGRLELTNVNAEQLRSGLISNEGTTVLTNGKYVSGAVNIARIFDNKGTLTLNGTRVDADKATKTIIINAGTLTLTNAKVYSNAGAKLVEIAAHDTTTTINGGNYEVGAVVTSPAAVPGTTTSRGDGSNQAAAKLVVNGGTFKVSGIAMELDNGVVATLANANVTESMHAVYVKNADVTINSGTYNAISHAVVAQGATKATLTVNGGTFKSDAYAMYLDSAKTTYSVTGGIFEGGQDLAAIEVTLAATVKDGEATVNPAVAKILKGGKYLNRIIARVSANGGYVDVTDQLIADGYTVKDADPYKEVVPTKAPSSTVDPNKGPEEQAPNTYDAGLVYMGLAISAIGASVVSVKKLRNN